LNEVARRYDGFTLIEMVVTVAIVALLASVALPMVELTIQRDKEQELRAALRQIRGAIDAYKKAADEGRIAKNADESGYPKTLEVLEEGVEDIKQPDKPKIYLLRRIPRDPMANDPVAKAADTWGKRSYASPPEDPKEGDDVFDIYSRADSVGLNGIPYRQW
jgi:general secretion pathway protein G